MLICVECIIKEAIPSCIVNISNDLQIEYFMKGIKYIYIYLFESLFSWKNVHAIMQRTVKLDWDYKILHTSGEKVVKPVKMTERFIQN